MKILHLISSGGYYGAEAVVVNLSQALQGLGTGCTVGVFDNRHNSNLDVALAAGRAELPVELIACRGRTDWRAVRSIREVARRERTDVIHAHGYKAQIYAYLAARSLPVALVATCHGYPSRFSTAGRLNAADLRQRLYTSIDRVLLSRFDQVVATSSILAETLRRSGIKDSKLTVIRNGVDWRPFHSALPSADLAELKRGRFAIGLVARLTEGKGHAQLFRALKGVLVEHPDALAVVVGEGPLGDDLQALAVELGIHEHVVFTGKRSDMPNVYAALDIVVLPSFEEGMPMVVLEALASARAMIATPVGSVPDVIRDGETGLLIEAGNVAALETAIRRLMEDLPFRQSLAWQGQAFLEANFSSANMAAEYLNVYERAARQ